MNDLSGKFTLYEMLRIVIPGVYAVTMSRLVFAALGLHLILEVDGAVLETILFVLFSIMVGLFFYSFDLPKNYLFKSELPTTRIKKRHPEIDKLKISNSYFSFYYGLHAEQKQRSDSFIGFYHFSAVNMIISFLFVVICLLWPHTLLVILKINILVFVLSSITAYMLFKNRIHFVFDRHLQMYYDSDEYKKLIE